MKQFDPEWVYNEVLRIHHELTRLNLILDQASEVELYRIRELKDPSRADEYPNFFALALEIQAQKLTKKLDRT